ncbi:MAG: alpha/beta fold hydrolase [Candidatus Schekmanbacteria bacterium]|nr:alpha/beta fold hydrolase [Candidatus Schekmanbacteria bacterium]
MEWTEAKRARIGKIELAYELGGNPSGPPALLIMGLGSQLTMWPESFCEALAGAGLRVIRFDNRDVGLSTKLDHQGRPQVVRHALFSLLGMNPPTPYTLTEMADDAAALLDALRVGQAHVIGASMGGMIGQLLAVFHAERVSTLTSMMSAPRNPLLYGPSPRVLLHLARRPATGSRENIIEHTIATFEKLGGPGFRASRDDIRAIVTTSYDRSPYRLGFTRQAAAVFAAGDRRRLLRHVSAPTLVIHGDSDPLIPVAAAYDTAAAIPGASLEIIAGLGHDLPPLLHSRVAERIARHIFAADAARLGRVEPLRASSRR